MSPPSLATAGRTRASISSLMVATVSESLASKNSPAVAVAAASSPRTIGAPDMKCSMMAPRIAGLSCCHSPLALVTAMKSEPKNTPETPAIANRRSASGDCAAASPSRMSSVPLARTVRPGRNFSVAGFGVGSVWMNMASSFAAAASKACAEGGLVIVIGGAARRKFKMPPAPFAAWDASRHRIELLVGEVAGHDGDRDGKLAGALADAGDERSRPLLAGRGRQHQDGDVLVVLDEIEDLLRFLALADHARSEERR